MMNDDTEWHKMWSRLMPGLLLKFRTDFYKNEPGRRISHTGHAMLRHVVRTKMKKGSKRRRALPST